METNIKMYPKKICRTCLCESEQTKAITAKIGSENRTILEMIIFVANINILVENKLPTQVCGDCESILYKADAFKRKCLESELFLTQYWEMRSQTHTDDETPQKTLVKDETDLLSFEVPAASTTSCVKQSNASIKEIIASYSTKDEKVSLVGDIATSKHNSNSLCVNKDRIDDQNTFKDVKLEETELDDQNQESFDFDDAEMPEAFVTISKECEEEKTVSTVFTCSCSTVCTDKNEYRLHIFKSGCSGFKKCKNIKVEKNTNNQNKKNEKPICCPKCNQTFKTAKSCRRHQRIHADEVKDYECTMCMRKFSRKSAYTNHMKNHELKSSVKFICDTCKREFQHKAHLDNHILAVHTKEKGFPCEECLTNFSTQASLDNHKESHKVEKRHQCDICNKAFIMLSTLNDHLRVHTGEKPFLCSICGKGFSQKTNLAQHVRRHQGLKPFKCEDCDRRFVSKGELVAHGRSHSGAHPFVCEDCGGGFTTSSSLVKHRRTHTGERPYACDLCPMKFAASGTLKNHRRTHTGEKPFQCSYCEKAFVQRQDLISHIRGHTGERPYTCGCGQSFRKASALKAHVRLHGKDPPENLALLQPTML